MMRKTVVAVLALAALSGVLGVRAEAQTPNCNIGVQVCSYDRGRNILVVFPLLPVNPQCVNTGPWCDFCSARSNQCAPPNGPAEACPGCNAGKTPQGTGPIDLATGNTNISESDIAIPGLGGGLALSRAWNSMLPAVQASYSGMFGVNWRSNYEERLVFNSSDGYLKYARGDGSVWSFGLVTAPTGYSNTYQTAAPANATAEILQLQDSSTLAISWTLTYKSGEKRTFDNSTGALLSIIDRNGNTTQLSYDSSHRLATVTDAAGRHLNFSYPNSSSNLVNAVTSDVGISLSYSYDSQGRLTQVTKPDNTTISFAYDAQNRIITVTDSNGKILESHTYDASGRGLTSSRANGVDAVTVTYPQ